MTEPPEWPRLELGTLFKALKGTETQFVVIGAIARIGQGSPRLTNDLDICPAPGRRNLSRLAEALNPLGPSVRANGERLPVKLDAAFFDRTKIALLETSAGWIDVLQEPKGSRGFASLSERADVAEIDGVEVEIASIEDQIAMKLAAGRQRDLADVEELRALARLRAETGDTADDE